MVQVKSLTAAVKQSVEITNSTTLLQRIRLILMDPVNRRALSAFLPSKCRACALLNVCYFSSHWLWPPSIPATVRFQHSESHPCLGMNALLMFHPISLCTTAVRATLFAIAWRVTDYGDV